MIGVWCRKKFMIGCSYYCQGFRGACFKKSWNREFSSSSNKFLSKESPLCPGISSISVQLYFWSAHPIQFQICKISTTGQRNMKKMTPHNGSLARQNYPAECESLVNEQINMELHASYVYLSMAYYFQRDDVAFPGMHKFFKKASDEEREHAQMFMDYQNIRGGRIVLHSIAKPSVDEWNSPLEAMSAALELEKTVNANILKIHGIASSNNDPQLCDFLESNFLEEQVKAIKELSDYVTQLQRCGSGLGEFIFDKETESK